MSLINLPIWSFSPHVASDGRLSFNVLMKPLSSLPSIIIEAKPFFISFIYNQLIDSGRSTSTPVKTISQPVSMQMIGRYMHVSLILIQMKKAAYGPPNDRREERIR